MAPLEIDEVVKNLRDNRNLKWRFNFTPTSWERASTTHRGYRYTVWGGRRGMYIEHMPEGEVLLSLSVDQSELSTSFLSLYDKLNDEAPPAPAVQSMLDDAANSLT